MLIYYATVLGTGDTYADSFPLVQETLETLGSNSYELSGLPSGCSRVFDVTNFLPRWLTDEDLNGDTLMVKFLQYYYDWYYCSSSSGIYANEIFDYIDPLNYNENVYLDGLNTYFPGIKTILNESPDYPELNLNNVKQLILGVKPEVLQRKGTEAALNIFFGTLFDEIVSVVAQFKDDTPIDTITNKRLEVTVYYSEQLNSSAQTLVRRLISEYFIPYGLGKTELGQPLPILFEEYSNSFRDFENDDSAIESYNSGSDGVTLNAYEAVKIGNYIVYNMGDTGSLDYNTGCSSASPPPRGITANIADMPTYTHPNWYIGVSGATSFGDINISEFLFLPYENNPNIGITGC